MFLKKPLRIFRNTAILILYIKIIVISKFVF